jgi:3-oxoacyl-[acyl-carrier-protein] synthase-3
MAAAGVTADQLDLIVVSTDTPDQLSPSTILVIGAYAMSKWLNLDDYTIATLFADGAGAAIVRATKSGRGFSASYLYTAGEYHDHMGIYGGGMSMAGLVLEWGA